MHKLNLYLSKSRTRDRIIERECAKLALAERVVKPIRKGR